MANAMEDALNRGSAEQKERNQQVIEEARRNIKLVSMQSMEDISPTSADSIARNAQIIEEAKRNIPFETMQHVDEISPPMNTPTEMGYSNSNIIELNPTVKAQIEGIEQGGGNNYLRENAVDRAMNREVQQPQQQEQQQQMSR